MTMLEGFVSFNLNEGVPYLSVTKNGVTFNKSVILKLNKPSYVVLLINPNTKQIAIKTCEKNTENAYPFYDKDKKGEILSIRWNMRDLLNTLKDMMDWDYTSESYKVTGNLIPEESAMIFDLEKAEIF